MKRDRASGFTLIEIVVSVAIIGVLLSILLPAMEKSRERANDLKCMSNLSQIGLSLQIYSQSNHGQYPRTVYDPAAPLCVGTNAAAADPFRPGGPQPNDLSADLFLLLRSKAFSPNIFNEPYDDELENVPDPAADPTSRSNFTDWKKNLGYSYANPYPDANAVAAGYQLGGKINPGFALMADLNPGEPGKNSRNHERRGQNVLYADGHVEWKTTTSCGLNGDDIYTNKAGAVQASPVDAADSVLLPTDK